MYSNDSVFTDAKVRLPPARALQRKRPTALRRTANYGHVLDYRHLRYSDVLWTYAIEMCHRHVLSACVVDKDGVCGHVATTYYVDIDGVQEDHDVLRFLTGPGAFAITLDWQQAPAFPSLLPLPLRSV